MRKEIKCLFLFIKIIYVVFKGGFHKLVSKALIYGPVPCVMASQRREPDDRIHTGLTFSVLLLFKDANTCRDTLKHLLKLPCFMLQFQN